MSEPILGDAGLHGHSYVIGAMLSATALASPGPVTVLTSNPTTVVAHCSRCVALVKI